MKELRDYDLLVRSNPEFDQIQIQILEKQEVPCLIEGVTIIWSEESRTLMLDSQPTHGLAMTF